MNENFSLNPHEIKLLRQTIDQKIISLNTSHIPDEYDFWWPLYIELDGISLKITSELTVANYFDGKEDCSRLTIRASKDETPVDYVKTIQQVVHDVVIITKIISFPGTDTDNNVPFQFTYPRALLFQLDNCVLTIERGWHFEEYLMARLQDKNDIELTDELPDWYDPDEDCVKPTIRQVRKSLRIAE